MPARFLGLCALLVVAGCSAAQREEVTADATAEATAETTAKATVWNFDDVDAGTVPAGFTVAVGEWKVVEDNTAPSGSHVLAQVAKSSPRDFNVVLVDDVSRQDVDLSVSFLSIAGEVDQGGGLVWRAKDANNYYIARYNPLEDNYRVYKVVEGKRRQLQNSDIDHTPGWHTVHITMVGDRIRCSYDGKQYLDVQDTTFTEAGKIGLWTKADAQTHFDDMKVR